MIFTPSDVGSLSNSLSRWEIAEYVSEGFVIIGCAGELVASFFTKIPEDVRKHIETWSTIVLILALSIGLKCLIKTNELSGNVIGSLGDRAAEAGRKADEADGKAIKALQDSSTALTQAADALSKAGKAAESLGKAESEASKAQTASSNALALAQGARQEADSFEKDIVSAKTQAADAESHLADALRQAAAATAELNRLKSPRILTNASGISSVLKQFAGTEYTFTSVFSDEDSIALLKQIDSVLQLAGWKRVKPNPAPVIVLNVYGKEQDFGVAPGTSTGVGVEVDSTESIDSLRSTSSDRWPTTVRAAGLLKNNLAAFISPVDEGNVQKELVVTTGSSVVVRISIGKKP